MYDVGGKLLNGIRNMYFNSLAYIRAKGGENEYLRINSCMKHGCIMSPWLFIAYMKEVTMEIGRRGVSEWRLPGFLYADNLVLRGDLRAMGGRFVDVYGRRSLKFKVR